MRFSPEFIDSLLERVVLSDLIGRRIKLTKKGHEALGLCPFHHEKTPSFTINDDKGFYHCFGCGAHGTAIRYLMETEKLPFLESVEMLANMIGMPLPKEDPQEEIRQKHRAGLTEIMEVACRYFEEQLNLPVGKKAQDYLKGRGLLPDTIKNYHLGFAPRGNGLLKKLQQQKTDLRIAYKLGLLAYNQSNGSWRDYFYDRVMFPIFDRKKHVIGFSGRMLEKGEPKYLNSPETDLFHKGEQLFELPFAIETIRKLNEAIVVEGNMDVISLHQNGWTQAVAPLGTAFTENQLQILWHLCDEPTLCFDGDTAGQHAMIRAMNRAMPLLIAGKSLKFATMPSGQDPDDLIRHAPETFKNIIQHSTSLIDVFWGNLLITHPLKTPEQLAKTEKDGLEMIQKIQDENIRNLYIKEIKYRFKQLIYQLKNPSFKIKKKIKLTLPNTDKILLSYLYAYPIELTRFVDEIASMDFFADLHEKALINGWIEATTKGEIPPIPDTEKELMKAIDIIKKQKSAEDVCEEVSKIINNLKLQELQILFKEKQNEYFKTEKPEIKEEIDLLRDEIENFLNQDD